MYKQAIDLVNSWDEDDIVDPGWEIINKTESIDKWCVKMDLVHEDGRTYRCRVCGSNEGKYSTFAIDGLIVDNRWIALDLPIGVHLTLDEANSLTADDVRLLVLEAMSNG